ncbi:MAG: hypothetical protein JNL70_10690 [Saprospiraceae bacterium]|nr:hypothetical protein [Saprospiraceae bacterium]
MDAIIRNDCEKELLLIYKEVIEMLDINIKIESEAFSEGGLKEIWKFIGDSSQQLTLLVAVLAIVYSRIPVENKELVQLQIENLKIDNELKKNELKKIKNEVLSQEVITNDLIEKVIEKLDSDYKIIWHKSNFYKRLNLYPKVVKFSTQEIDENNIPINEPKAVKRDNFSSFILRSDRISPLIDENALIDIISPVLKKGKFSWRGFYNGEVLSFEMKDATFKEAVLNKRIEFSNGTIIKCVLCRNRKIDDIGLIQATNNEVLTVFEVVSSDTIFETPQGKKYYRDKELRKSQLELQL